MNLLWLQSGGCGGCTMSMMCAEAPDLLATLDGAGIDLLWHPTLSEATGAEVVDLLQAIVERRQGLDILCVEGSLLLGPNGSGRFHMMAGTGRPMIDWVRDLAARARHVVAVGTCAAFGGITAAGVNPADACGLQYDGRQKGGLLGPGFRAGAGLPVINVAGCPTHPNWVTETLMLLAGGDMAAGDLDLYQRPRFYADHLVHHGCPRNEYYEYKASAHKPSDLGCMMEHMGCLGTQAHADCNTRLWNGEGSCTRGGYACINCTAPEFEEPGHMFLETPKLAGIPIGLPTDMPKAWFVALSSLAKAATPDRVRRNAATDRIVVPPTVHEKRKR
ncbi:NiFe hydrogenase small subunit HydA [Zavarzinia compransoris]|uniref:hydrogenase (acceptor) n=2 Tax=Zavarzinia compransoris TaxID=1264899 RepID=A0A317EBT3_9PROT|nr:HupU protein [Zavarzinia compransoris]TDP46301.1 NiFe hydrogenase small subunit HydA [Zavarzinia compransoris]